MSEFSEFIDREKAIAKIKAAYCCGCENYNGVKCRACQIMDAMDVLEDEPAVVPDVQRWRKTAEEPPTEADANDWGMPLPKRPGERPKKLYWREKAGTKICPVCGYECNDDYYLDKFCPGCGTRLWFDEEEAEHDQPDM